jgi:hypothetical protein
MTRDTKIQWLKDYQPHLVIDVSRWDKAVHVVSVEEAKAWRDAIGRLPPKPVLRAIITEWLDLIGATKSWEEG